MVDINFSKGILEGLPYDYAPFNEHLMRVIARKNPHNSVASRLVRWLFHPDMIQHHNAVRMPTPHYLSGRRLQILACVAK